MKYIFNLKQVRKKKGITQIEIAKMLGTTQAQYWKYESGLQEPTLERLVDMARILNVSLDELITFSTTHDEYSNQLHKLMNDEEED